MKKFAIVLGLSALMIGCGGGGDCEEGTVPPDTTPPIEAQFPRGQEPEYIVRNAGEIGFAKFKNKEGRTGQVLGIEFDPEDINRYTITVQEFTADYSQGYLTKPTSNVYTYDNPLLRGVLGGLEGYFSHEDRVKLKDALLTMKHRDNFEDSLGNLQPIFDVYFPVMGPLQEVTGDTVKINGMTYPKGIADEEVYVGGHVAGLYDGEKLNVYSLSFAADAWGYAHSVTVLGVVDETSFSYLDSDGNVVVAVLREQAYLEKSDRFFTTENMKAGMTLVVSGWRVDYNTMEALDVNAYNVE